MANDKRETPRIQPYVAACRVLDRGQRASGYVMDLSPRGARISSDGEPPLLGGPVVIEVRFARSSPHSLLPGHVRWVKSREGAQTTCSFGMTFEGLTAEQQQVLNSVIDEFRRRAGDLD